MKKTYPKFNTKLLSLYLFFSALVCLSTDGLTQGAKVVKYNGATSTEHTPQGMLNYQRQFYLITAEEMQQSDLESGMEINSIGFSMATKQEAPTEGVFRVYLQNTTDTVSRMDTTWIEETTSNHFYNVTGLHPGVYEWQVFADCDADTIIMAQFSNDGLPVCSQPDSLYADSITETSAILHWKVMNPSVVQDYKVSYRESQGDGAWTTRTTSELSDTLTGLTENTQYLWRVMSVCSGDESPRTASSFVTNYTVSCSAPYALSVTDIEDTAAIFRWEGDSTAFSYDIRLRREGSQDWNSFASVTDTMKVNFLLVPGTKYEWQVRIVCDSSTTDKGAFVDGDGFMTLGDTACYPPLGLMTTGITDSSAMLSWVPVPGATEYTLKYRLKESISWTSVTMADGMTTVHNDTVAIPSSKGLFPIALTGPSTFTYSGDGLYVAYEYENTSIPITTPYNALCNEQPNVRVSFVAQVDTSATGQAAVLSATDLRPETWLGSAALRDSIRVDAVYAMGRVAIPFANPTEIAAAVTNLSPNEKTVDVSLDIKALESEVSSFSSTTSVTIPGGMTQIIDLGSWSPDQTGIDSLIVSVPKIGAENVTGNNRNYLIQRPNKWIASYADESSPMSKAAVGFGTGAGLILNKHYMNGCGTVTGVKVHLDPSAADKTISAVVLDKFNVVVAESATVEPKSEETNRSMSFYFSEPVAFADELYYIGLHQTADSEGYFPVSVQWDGDSVRTDAFYTAASDGSGLTSADAVGRHMIEVEVVPTGVTPFIYGGDVLCGADSIELQTGTRDMRFASELVDFSSEYPGEIYNASELLGAPVDLMDPALTAESWLSETPDSSREYVVLRFPDPEPINIIEIYQTVGPGAVDSVIVSDTSGAFEIVYTDSVYVDSAEVYDEAFEVLTHVFPMTGIDVSTVRISLNSEEIPGYNGLDAVAIGQIDSSGVFDSYSWSPGNETTSSIRVGNAGDYTVQVVHSGCTTSVVQEVITAEEVQPVIVVEGPTTLCEGESVVLKSDREDAVIWSNGHEGDSLIVTEAGSYTVAYDNGCDTIESASVEIIVNPTPYVSIDGGVICLGSTGILNAGSGFAQYEWSTGDTTQTISVSTINLFSVTVTDVNGCEGDTFKVTSIRTPPSPAIAGAPEFCPGDQTVLDVGGGYSTYTWSSGATTQTVVVSAPGLMTVTVTDEVGCSGTDAIMVNALDAPEPFISGSLGICVGNSTQLDAGGGYIAYNWSSGETTQTINVDTADTFTVTVTDSYGCTGSTSATTTLDGSIPDSPGPITGPEMGLCGETSVTYSIDPVPNTVFYVWTVPEGVTISSGQGTTSITVDFGPSFSGGYIIVAANNECGQSPSIDPTFIEVQGFPEEPGTISGLTSIGCDHSGHMYSIEAVDDASTYTWTVPPGAEITSGQGSTSIMVTFGVEGGSVCVSADNSCGNSTPNCISVSTGSGTSLTVSNTFDSGEGSLRKAIVDACWGDSILFDPSLTGESIVLTSGEIAIQKHVHIIGLGKSLLHVSGNGASRVFNIAPGVIALFEGITMTNAYAPANGGAFYNRGTVTLVNVGFDGNYDGSEARAFTSESHVIIGSGSIELLQ